MLPLTHTDSAVRESTSSMNVTTEKAQYKELHQIGISSHGSGTRLNLNINLHKNISIEKSYKNTSFTTAESTCESSGVFMNCSEEFHNSDPIEKSEELLKSSRDMTMATSTNSSNNSSAHGPITQSSSGPSARAQNPYSSSCPFSMNDTSKAIYYFGYGPIVNPIVRYRRGCKIPTGNTKTAILYDHRLKFVAGGTANIVPSRGWDVKGVVLRFESEEEWEEFRQFDANYDLREVSVSVIDKTNIDPKNKNDHTAPFEDYDGGSETNEGSQNNDSSQRSGSLILNHRMHKSCMASSHNNNSSLNDLSGNDSSDSEEDYSCPFSFEPKSKKADPNAIKCWTFMVDQETGQSRHEQTSSRGKGGTPENVVGMPQERYLKLMTDGLRDHEIDETYIHDEVLSAPYIPNDRDRVVDENYRCFPTAKKLTKVSFGKYELKLCNTKDNPTLFVIGTKILKVDGNPPKNSANLCVRWLRKLAHGQGDITLLVHQTFVDKDCLHIPLVDYAEDVTELHHQWAEHVVFLYLERGGLTATVVGELVADSKGGGGFLKMKKNKLLGSGGSMPLLSAFKKKSPKNGTGEPNQQWGGVRHGSMVSSKMMAAAREAQEDNPDSVPTTTKRFGGRFLKSSKPSKG